jgi:hypothetical protein
MSSFAKFVIFSLLVGGAYYLVAGNRPAEKVTETKPEAVAGWQRLDECSPMQSLKRIPIILKHSLRA